MEKKRGIWHLVICVGLICLIWGGYFCFVNKINFNKRVERIKEMKNSVDYYILAEIEKVEGVNDDYLISGWGVVLNAKQEGVDLVLKPLDGSELIVCETNQKRREDIDALYSDEYTSGKLGFISSVKRGKLQDDVVYEVLIGISYSPTLNNDVESKGKTHIKKIAMGQYVYNGQIYNINPLTFEEPDSRNDRIREVVDNGVLCGYVPECKSWTYLYDNNLYYLIKDNNEYSLDRRPSIPSGIYTNQGEDVSEADVIEYTKNGYILRETYLDENHYVIDEDTAYLFVTMQLPQNFPVTYVHTGLYLNRNPQGFIFEENLHLYRYYKERTE